MEEKKKYTHFFQLAADSLKQLTGKKNHEGREMHLEERMIKYY